MRDPNERDGKDKELGGDVIPVHGELRKAKVMGEEQERRKRKRKRKRKREY